MRHYSPIETIQMHKVTSTVFSDGTDVLVALEAHISIFGKSLLSGPTARPEISIILGKTSIRRKQHKINQPYLDEITLANFVLR